MPAKAIFGQFIEFFKCKKWFSRPLFYEILIFFTATFFSLAYFSFFFMCRKNRFHGHKRNVFNFTRKNIEFFHRHRFRFHRWIFWKYSRENIHWNFFWAFFDFFTTTFFVTAIFSVFFSFFSAYDFFLQEKKHYRVGPCFLGVKSSKNPEF